MSVSSPPALSVTARNSVNPTNKTAAYIGRFAPSPTGPLHLGSLLAAVASYVDAKHHHGQWLLRIEDVDEYRCVAGSESSIKRCLEAHGLLWDGEIYHQTTRKAQYHAALEQLAADDRIFFCDCNRKSLRQHGAVYSGRCRSRRQVRYREATRQQPANYAIRFDLSPYDTTALEFTDRVLGKQSFPAKTLGDFIIRRRDSLFAYQLAVSVDDIEQGITHVVRGADLLASTPWQLAVIDALHAEPPSYAHLPLIVHAAGDAKSGGDKLSKQTGAPAVDERQASVNLGQVLSMLGQPLPSNAAQRSTTELLEHAIKHWQIEQIPQRAIPISADVFPPTYHDDTAPTTAR